MRYIAAMCFLVFFCFSGFSLTVDELKNLDSAKAATMTLPELLVAKDSIESLSYSHQSTFNGNNTGNSNGINEFESAKNIITSQILYEMFNLDSSKIAAMPFTVLVDTKEAIKKQKEGFLMNDNGKYSYNAADLVKLKKLQSIQTNIQSQIDYLYFRGYNAFDHLGAFHEYDGTVKLIFGIIGLGTTFIVPAAAKPHAWGWWVLPSAAFSIVVIHLGITEINLGADLKGYGARITIPVK